MGLNDSNYRKLVFSFIRNFPLNNVSEHLLYQITNSEWFRKGSVASFVKFSIGENVGTPTFQEPRTLQSFIHFKFNELKRSSSHKLRLFGDRYVFLPIWPVSTLERIFYNEVRVQLRFCGSSHMVVQTLIFLRRTYAN